MSKLFDWLEQKPVNAMHEVLEAHKMTGESVGGLLGKCACGEAVDWDTQHWAEVLEREGFGDLKPARQLVKDWRQRSLEILDKARYLESTGATPMITQYRLIRSQAYNFMSIKLDQIVNAKHLKGN